MSNSTIEVGGHEIDAQNLGDALDTLEVDHPNDVEGMVVVDGVAIMDDGFLDRDVYVAPIDRVEYFNNGVSDIRGERTRTSVDTLRDKIANTPTQFVSYVGDTLAETVNGEAVTVTADDDALNLYNGHVAVQHNTGFFTGNQMDALHEDDRIDVSSVRSNDEGSYVVLRDNEE